MKILNKNNLISEFFFQIDSDDDVKSEQVIDNNEEELIKIQGKASIVVTAKALKRKLESEFINKEESDDDCPQKKIAPLLENAEITITPIQKVSAAVTSSSDDKQNGNII